MNYDIQMMIFSLNTILWKNIEKGVITGGLFFFNRKNQMNYDIHMVIFSLYTILWKNTEKGVISGRSF